MDETPKTPHCLILPFPIQGHINPLLQFSKRLSHQGVYVTLTLPKRLHTFHSLPNVQIISDGYDDVQNIDVDYRLYVASFQRAGSQSLALLLDELRDSGRAVDCIVYDPFLPWAVHVAKKCGVLAAAFFTQSCGVNALYYNVYKGELKVPIWDKGIRVPGLPELGSEDMPSFMVGEEESNPGSLKLLLDQYLNIQDAHFVLVNSVYEMEKQVTDWMSKLLPVKTIGPTVPSMYLDKRILEDRDYGLSLFNSVDTCTEWLKGHSSQSVIYISFGSMARFQQDQMEELALGIKMTNKPFLWVVRSSEESKLPKSFRQEINIEQGLIVSWCPQLEVLAHDAIGCFVTHCGWNSTLEALSLGVPMVGVPWWSDQPTNAKFVMDVWEVGIRACPDEENIVRKDEISRCVEHVMDGERGEEMRENARKLKEMARKAVDEGGSSDTNIKEFVSALISSKPSLN